MVAINRTLAPAYRREVAFSFNENPHVREAADPQRGLNIGLSISCNLAEIEPSSLGRDVYLVP